MGLSGPSGAFSGEPPEVVPGIFQESTSMGRTGEKAAVPETHGPNNNNNNLRLSFSF
jgi:hypothetical protein